MSISRGMDTYDAAHAHNGKLLSHKNNEAMPFAATRMDLESIILSEVSQRRQVSQNTTYMWNPKKMIQMNLYLQNRKRLTEKTNLQLSKVKAGEDKLGN